MSLPQTMCAFCGKKKVRGRKKYCSVEHKAKMHNRRARWMQLRIFDQLAFALDPDAELDRSTPEGAQEFARLFWDDMAQRRLNVRVSRSRKE